MLTPQLDEQPGHNACFWSRLSTSPPATASQPCRCRVPCCPLRSRPLCSLQCCQHPAQLPGQLTASIFSSFCARSTTSPTSSANLCSCRRSRSSRRSEPSSWMRTCRVGDGPDWDVDWAVRQAASRSFKCSQMTCWMYFLRNREQHAREQGRGKEAYGEPSHPGQGAHDSTHRTALLPVHAAPTLVASCSASQWRGRIAGLRRSPTNGTEAR